MKKYLLIIAPIFLIVGFVFAYTSPGNPAGYVNDFAGALSADTKNSLEIELGDFAKQKGHEIAIVIVKNLGGDTIENYANLLFREWGIGKKELNNGVLFVVAIDDREMRIEVGYGLEGTLTDIESKHILNDFVKPYFKSGDYNHGVVIGARKIKEALIKELITENTTRNGKPKGFTDLENIPDLIMLSLLGLLILISWLGSILGRSKSWWLGGIVGGVLGTLVWWLTSLWYFILPGIIFGLIFDYFVSKNYRSGKRSWWAGGSRWGRGFGGGGFGGGGFGGFGGGSSGGGGASSKW